MPKGGSGAGARDGNPATVPCRNVQAPSTVPAALPQVDGQKEGKRRAILWIETKKRGISIPLLLCDSCRIQTCNLLIRSQMLYSVELRSHRLFLSKSGAKVHTFPILAKFFFDFFSRVDVYV